MFFFFVVVPTLHHRRTVEIEEGGDSNRGSVNRDGQHAFSDRIATNAERSKRPRKGGDWEDTTAQGLRSRTLEEHIRRASTAAAIG